MPPAYNGCWGRHRGQPMRWRRHYRCVCVCEGGEGQRGASQCLSVLQLLGSMQVAAAALET